MDVSKNNLFTIKKGEPNKVQREQQLEMHLLYTVWGKHDYLDEAGYPRLDNHKDAKPLAEIEIVDDNASYFVKRARDGRLFNPIGMYSEGREDRFMNHRGKPEWVLTSCSEKVFQYYIQFLKTKNTAWLRNAEREI